MYLLHRLGQFMGLAIFGLTFTGCAPVSVNSFLETGVDFTRYHTYKWDGDAPGATGDPRLDNNPFLQERVQADVEKELAARGFEKATSEPPELLIQYHASIKQRLELNDADRRHGPCDTCNPYAYDVGTLLLDLVDARTSRLVWRGWAEGSLDGVVDNQEWMEKRIDDAVARILATLPRRLQVG